MWISLENPWNKPSGSGREIYGSYMTAMRLFLLICNHSSLFEEKNYIPVYLDFQFINHLIAC